MDTNYISVQTGDSLVVDLTGVITSTSNIFDEQSEIKIYPNPTTGILYLESFDISFSSQYTYEIANLQGQVISSGTITNQTESVDLTSYSQGSYLIRFYDTNSQLTSTSKLFIQR